MNIVARLKELVAEERKIEGELIRLLLQVEDEKIHAKLGYPSVFEFCRRELGLCDGSAYLRVSAMRLSRREERCLEKIENGELSLSNAAKVETTLRQAKKQNVEVNQTELFESVLGATSKQADKIIEAVFPQEKPAKLPCSLEEKIEKLRALLAAKHQGSSREEILHLALDEAIEAHAPKTGDIEREVKSPEKRHVPETLRAAIFQRDGHCCSYVSQDGKKCNGTEFLEIDHIKPFALGGKTIAKNLRLLCRTHNQLAAKEHGLRRDHIFENVS